MSRSRTNQDAWDQIFDDLILENEPPVRYIKDALIITKNGARFRVSPDDFIDIVAREKHLDPDQSDIQSCSLSIDFARIKRDVNRWTNKFIDVIEEEAARMVVEEAAKKKTRPSRKKVD
jgi:hypothetical protein